MKTRLGWLVPILWVYASTNSAAESFAPTALETPSSLLNRASKLIQLMTNLTAAVDISTVDRRAAQSTPTLTKESWRFTRIGETNTFTRTRFLPFRSQEVIETMDYSGGRFVGLTNSSLPSDLSLPGFEPVNLLREMKQAKTVTDRREGDLRILTAEVPTGSCIAWFSTTDALPQRIEKHRGGQLLLVYACSRGSSSRFLPQRDTFHFYENGVVVTTVIRSFHNVEERSSPASGSPMHSSEAN